MKSKKNKVKNIKLNKWSKPKNEVQDIKYHIAKKDLRINKKIWYKKNIKNWNRNQTKIKFKRIKMNITE